MTDNDMPGWKRNVALFLTGQTISLLGSMLVMFAVMWHLTIENFPAIVTMDAHGNSLHRDVEQESARELAMLGA